MSDTSGETTDARGVDTPGQVPPALMLDAIDASTCAVDQNGVIVAVNRAWRQFAVDNGGDPEQSGVGTNYIDACAVRDGPDAETAGQVESSLRQLLAGTVTRFETDYPCHSPEQERWISVRGTALPGHGAVLSHVDISTVKRTEQALAHVTLHDGLTGLPNRQLLLDRVAQALSLTSRNDRHVALAFLDVDRFKTVNDTWGHAAGDELLCAVADRLRGHVRASDTVARFAGDEFVVVWPSIGSPTLADALVRRLLSAMSDPFVLSSGTIPVTASIGLAVGRAPSDVDELLSDADTAMYDAKSRGRGLVTVFTEELRDTVAARVVVEDELRAAVAREEFELLYQPVVDLRSRTVTGVEATLRWNSVTGARSPEAFLPAAEFSGIAVPLGAWTIDQACRQQVRWAWQGLKVTMAVNLSPRQLAQPGSVEMLERALRDSGMAADQLWVQVPESVVHVDAERARIALTGIGKLGASVTIDGFGTGAGSLLHLNSYPVRGLKVDPRFVAAIGSGNGDAVVASIAGLAHAVGALCFAGGVGTEQQLTVVTAAGCQYAQGDYFGAPVPAYLLADAVRHCTERLLGMHDPAPAVPPAPDSRQSQVS